MKAIISIVVVSACCVLITNGFFLGKKFKNGCDPNPCKNKAACVLDARNNSLSTCTCVDPYHGKHCELKTGCSAKPCRKGNCTNDRIFPSNYTCTCNAGFVGKNCDTADACLKNPCKTGRCSLDDKLKAVCSCPLGYGSKNCDKKNCTIELYKGKEFSKDSNKIYIDKSIHSKVESLEGLAKLCKVKLHIYKSFVLHPDPKVLTYDIKDKTNPHHYVGQAMSLEVYGQDNKLMCNDICLGKVPIPSPPAKCLIDGLHAINWKWSILDPKTVHTGYHTANFREYNNLREHHQVGCRDTKFN